MSNFKHIELFGGCGGMSLGLEKSGFELYFANELSPMAGETFALNLLNEDLELKAKNKHVAENTIWIKSNFPSDRLNDRLRENPFEARQGCYSDLSKNLDLKNKLLIGDIDQLLEFLSNNKKLSKSIEKQDIDLLSGGPPCQSFSLAGKRKKDDKKNLLPASFAKISGLLKPKVVILENVKGITSAFTENDEKYYAWLEVSKAFVLEGFVPVCMMLNSKYFGVAQNRPRFILFAFRKDIFEKIKRNLGKNEILKVSEGFYKKVNKHKTDLGNVTVNDFKYYDIESQPHLFDGKLLPKLLFNRDEFISAIAAIDDLKNTNKRYSISEITSPYGVLLNNLFKGKTAEGFRIANHVPRKHTFEVEARFRFYQVIGSFQNGLKKGATDLFTGKKVTSDLKAKLFDEFSKYDLLMKRGGEVVYTKPDSIQEIEEFVKTVPTKKHSQRALQKNEPAPAQLTIPDDLCHYDPESLRTMTVREMARFQSFPDWFEFRSKITTGGKMRKFEVPQYTQVGNAVPPILAKELGDTIVRLLTNI